MCFWYQSFERLLFDMEPHLIWKYSAFCNIKGFIPAKYHVNKGYNGAILNSCLIHRFLLFDMPEYPVLLCYIYYIFRMMMKSSRNSLDVRLANVIWKLSKAEWNRSGYNITFENKLFCFLQIFILVELWKIYVSSNIWRLILWKLILKNLLTQNGNDIPLWILFYWPRNSN